MFDFGFVCLRHFNPLNDSFQLSFGLKTVLNLTCKSLPWRDTAPLIIDDNSCTQSCLSKTKCISIVYLIN